MSSEQEESNTGFLGSRHPRSQCRLSKKEQLLSCIINTQLMMQESVNCNLDSTAKLAGEMQQVKDQLDVTNSLLQCLIDMQLDHEQRTSSCSDNEEWTAPTELESLGLEYINPLQVQESTWPRAHFTEPQYLPAEPATTIGKDKWKCSPV